jgi:hypothetical protein
MKGGISIFVDGSPCDFGVAKAEYQIAHYTSIAALTSSRQANRTRFGYPSPEEVVVFQRGEKRVDGAFAARRLFRRSGRGSAPTACQTKQASGVT